MKRQQVFVRAQLPSGRFVSADVLDLDQESFNALVGDCLFRAGVLVGFKDNKVRGEDITYRVRADRAFAYAEPPEPAAEPEPREGGEK